MCISIRIYSHARSQQPGRRSGQTKSTSFSQTRGDAVHNLRCVESTACQPACLNWGPAHTHTHTHTHTHCTQLLNIRVGHNLSDLKKLISFGSSPGVAGWELYFRSLFFTLPGNISWENDTPPFTHRCVHSPTNCIVCLLLEKGITLIVSPESQPSGKMLCLCKGSL